MDCAYADGGTPKKLPVDSLWSVLEHGMAVDPHRTALRAPAQPVHHLEGLVQPLPSEGAGSLSQYVGRWVKRCTSLLYLAGAIISFFLPAPSNVGGLRWSFAELRRATVRCASFLEGRHIQPGETVLLIIPSSAEFALMLWVCAFKCYTIVTLDGAVLEPGNEQLLQEYMNQLYPAVVVVPRQADAIAVNRHIGKRKPFLGITVEAPEAFAIDNWTSMPAIAADRYTDCISPRPAPDHLDRLAFVIYTSGTSNNKPKGCLRTVGEVLPGFTIVGGLPPVAAPVALINTKSCQAGAPSLLFAAWYSSNAAVLAGGPFCAETTLAAAASCRPLALSQMVHMADWVHDSKAYAADKVSSVRFVSLIGSAITMASLRRSQRTFPRARIVASFGMTEAACMIGWRARAPKIDSVPCWQGIAASGYALPGAKIKIVDESGKIVRRNEPGTLHLGGAMVCKGYVGGASAGAFYEEDGVQWLMTTDCALMDDAGLIYVLGRSDSMVVRNGVVIPPAAIENVLEAEFPATICVVTITTLDGSREHYSVFDKLSQPSSAIESLVVRKLGHNYRIGGAVDLGQIGLQDWPRTIAGKISTLDVAIAVSRCVAAPEKD